MTTPRLQSEAVRLGIISTKADVRPEDYRFAREQRRYSPQIENTPPITNWGHDILIGVGYLAFIAWACWMAGPLAAMLKG